MLQNIIKEIVHISNEGEHDWCETIKYVLSDEKWVQITWDSVNLHYPMPDDPVVYLKRVGVEIPNSLQINCFKESLYLTLKHDGKSFAEIDQFIQSYFNKVLELPYKEKHFHFIREML